jgi:O-antigen biosynthesis protein
MRILSLSNLFGSERAQQLNLPNGVSYYRLIRPFRELGWEVDFWQPKPADTVDQMAEGFSEKIKDFDIILTKQIDNPHAAQAILASCDYQNKPLIFDADDNLIPKDNKITERKQAYPDANEPRAIFEVYLQNVTAIAVSVPRLVDVYSPYNGDVTVLQNLCFPKDWKYPKKVNTDGRPTVGWAGTSSHMIDHQIIENVLPRVAQKHPDVVFSFVGHINPQDLSWLKVPRHNWAAYEPLTWWDDGVLTWPQYLANQGYDIGLAPLIDSELNQCRSLAKWFEYTMTDTPVVASNIGPYKNLYHQTDALLCVTDNDWVEAINTLIEQPKLRETYVRNAKSRIAKEYTNPKEWRTAFERFASAGFKGNRQQ